MPAEFVPRVVSRVVVAAALTLSIATGAAFLAAAPQARKDFTVTADHFAYTVSGTDKREIRVTVGDQVRITFDARDIPHSFTTDETTPHYRIDRRAEPGKPVTFEIHADQPGSTPIKCTLAADSKCRQMNMVLVVEKAR